MKKNGSNTLIGPLTALALYSALLLAAVLTLKGKPLALALIIVLGIGVKSFLHFLRERRGE